MAQRKPANPAPSSSSDTPTDAKDDKAAKDDKPLGPVLLFNAHLGPYVCNHLSERPKDRMPVGAAKDDPREKYDVVKIMVPPGLFLMEGERFALCEPNAGFKSRVRDHHMLILTDDPEISWAKEWATIRAPRAIEYVEDSGHVDTLKAILAVEKRDQVRQAIEEQIEAVSDESRGQQLARSTQRAHNRGKRSRSRRLLN